VKQPSSSKPFVGKLTVDKNIVDLLSRSTYQKSIANALREMISNAYDADATRVDITIDENDDTIVIRDNGSGMSDEDFRFYLRIAGSRRGKNETPLFKRKRIGQFGVGFLSVFPFCRSLSIVTTKEDSASVLSATIPTERYFQNPFKEINVTDYEVKGFVVEDPTNKSLHYTQITLGGLTEVAKHAIKKQLASKEIKTKPGKRRVHDVTIGSAYDRLKWELQEELPLSFPKDSDLNKVFEIPETETIRVFLNDNQLFRNEIMGSILTKGSQEIAGISFSYAILTPWKPVAPVNLRNVKIRLNNVGVGGRTDFGIQKTRQFKNIAWVTGEVNITSGLDKFISVSRDNFLDSEDFENFIEKMAFVLRKQAGEVEKINDSDRVMGKHLKSSKQSRVASKGEIVKQNVAKLVERGFEVRRITSKESSSTTTPPVRVDKNKRTVTVVTDHPGLKDTLEIAGAKYELEYERFPETTMTGVLPCKLVGSKTIKINTNYPLYNSSRYGELFKRICILIELAQTKTHSTQEMKTFLLENIEQQFSDYK